MTGHIGIVACSAEGAALCYRTICHEGAALLGPHGHPAWIDWLVLRRPLARILRLAILKPCAPKARLTWRVLHGAEAVAEAAQQRGYHTLGLTGTRWLVDSNVYPQALAARGLACVRPSPPDRDAMGRIIMQELVAGVVEPASTEHMRQIIARLLARAALHRAVG